jgi:L-tartrate/succinate antiporter
MGKFTRKEMMMALLILAALALWIFGGQILHATTVTLVVISLMIISGIVKWDEILGYKQAWSVLAWFATLVTLADGLNRVGFVSWFAKGAASLLVGIHPLAVMVILVALFFIVHYLFASLTAHTTAVLPIILAAGVAVPGLPVRIFAMLLCYSMGLMGVLTPYATGPAPVYFGSGYISRKDFWTLGFIFGMIFLAVLLVIGLPYLLFINP